MLERVSQLEIDRWHAAWQSLGTVAPEGLLAKLQESYAEPHRAYHTLQHIQECLAQFDEVRRLADHPEEIEIALWFHDAIYNPHRSNNETLSAEWAREAILQGGAEPGAAERVHDLIIVTQHEAEPAGNDACLLVDVDLSILGAEPGRFDKYEQQVREEYRWVPESMFRKSRGKILRGFLDRQYIYRTDHFADRLERQARTNLARSLARLAE